MRIGWLIVLLLLAGPAWAVEGDDARTFPTRTLSSVGNYAPDSSGENISAYDGTCTVQLAVTSGQIRVNVEAGILQQDGTPLGWVNTGTLDASEMVTLTGAIDRVRYYTTCCETDCSDGAGGAGSCLASIVLRCRK